MPRDRHRPLRQLVRHYGNRLDVLVRARDKVLWSGAASATLSRFPSPFSLILFFVLIALSSQSPIPVCLWLIIPRDFSLQFFHFRLLLARNPNRHRRALSLCVPRCAKRPLVSLSFPGAVVLFSCMIAASVTTTQHSHVAKLPAPRFPCPAAALVLDLVIFKQNNFDFCPCFSVPAAAVSKALPGWCIGWCCPRPGGGAAAPLAGGRAGGAGGAGEKYVVMGEVTPGTRAAGVLEMAGQQPHGGMARGGAGDHPL